MFWCLFLCHHQCPCAVIGHFACVWKNYILINLVCYSFVPAPDFYCWQLSCSFLFYIVCVILTVNCTCALGFLCVSDLWLLFLVGCVFVAVFFLLPSTFNNEKEKSHNKRIGTKPPQTLCSRVWLSKHTCEGFTEFWALLNYKQIPDNIAVCCSSILLSHTGRKITSPASYVVIFQCEKMTGEDSPPIPSLQW